VIPGIQQLEVFPAYGQQVLGSKGIRRFINRIVPRHTYVSLRFEIHLSRVRLKSRSEPKLYKKFDNVKVNIISGPYGKPGWINVDAYEMPLINCVYDCRKSLPFPNDSARGIFCEHFFEHIDYTEEAPYFLSECYRVLKPGGVIRLIVPDAEKYLRAYCEGNWEQLRRIRPLDSEDKDVYFHCKYNAPMELINVVFRQGHEHKYAYDCANLDFLLRRYGFSTVARQAFGQSLMPELCLDQPIRASESLYVDARK
jgi:predicted SAM-dependent methyltransferase